MIDDCGAALDDEGPSENDKENQSAGVRLMELLPAAMIVGLAFTIACALLRQAGPDRIVSLEVAEAAPAQTEAAPEAEAVNFRFATLPLRAALREMGDRTGSIQPASLEPPARPSIFAQDRRIDRRGKAPRSALVSHPRPPLLRPTRKTQATNPLTVVGRTAGAMAERFATDLRALPGQISTILGGR